MSPLEILYSVQHIAQIFGRPIEMALEQYNNLLKTAQAELFSEYANGYLTGNGMEVNPRVSAAMSLFKKSDSFTGVALTVSTSGGFGVSNTKFQLPTAVYYPLEAWSSNDSSDYPDKVTKIDIVTTSEAQQRLSDSITYPSDNYPIMFFDREAGSTQFQCYVIPSTFSTIQVYSLYYPEDPVLYLNVVNGVAQEDDTTTVPLTFTAPYHVDIIRIILKYLGVIVGNNVIEQYTENQENKEK